MVCMSSALSLPAMRNLACCQTNPARSRVVKYFRAASPRANQKSEAPIIIVLSTSKNAAPVGSGSAAGGGATSAAAADAAPATWARVSSSACTPARADRRTRSGPRGTKPSLRSIRHPARVPDDWTLAGPAERGPPGQQWPIASGGTQTVTGPTGGSGTVGVDGRWGAVVDSGGSRPPGTDVVGLGTTGVGGAETVPSGPRPPAGGRVGTAGSVTTGAPPPSTVEVRVLVPPLAPAGGGPGVGAGQGTG